MNKEFVNYEEALALKELGFDEPCLAHYDEKILYKNGEDPDLYLPALTFSQAFRWFREEHRLIYTIGHIGHTDSWTFSTENIGLGVANQTWSVHYSTYEEAELACLTRLIEIVKSK